MTRFPTLALIVANAAVAAAQPPRIDPASAADNVLAVHSVIGSEQHEWSPDGSTIMFQSALSGTSSLWGIKADGGFPLRLAPNLGAVPYQSNYLPAWSPKGDWIAYTSGKSGATEIWLWSPADGRDVQLTRLGQTRINSMSWSPDGRTIAFAGDRYGSYDIWTVAVPTAEVTRLTTDLRYDVYPTFTPDGATILFVQLDERWVDHNIMAIPAGGGTPRLVARDTDFFDYGAGKTFGYPMPSPDGKSVLFRSHRSGWINYWVAPMAGGAARPLAAETHDQSGARWSPDGKSVVYVGNRNGTQDVRVVSAAGGEARVLVAPAIGTVNNPAWSPDGARIAYTLGTPTEAPELFVIPTTGGSPRQLTMSAPGGNVAASLVAPEKITYQSGAFRIAAYLYRPRTLKPGERGPGLMFIHGGPTAQFSDNYQAQVQFFVSQGYTVLLPNIRGSSGYGRAFEDANNKDWGHGDLDDVKAGAEYLKRLPAVDAERIGITGTSYGGCMTMSAIAFAPGFFQAAVAGAGYGDWIDFYSEQEYRHVKLLDYEFGPLTPTTEPIYRRSSPYFEVSRIQTPVMLVHGTGRFPNSHASKRFADELERYYKVFSYKTYPNENYYVNNPVNQRQMFLDMLEFFDQYLKDRPAGRGPVSTGSGR